MHTLWISRLQHESCITPTMWWHRANAAAPCKNAHAMWEPTPCVSAGVLKASTIFDLQWISRWQNGQLIFKYVFGNISECKSGRHNSCDVVKLSYCCTAITYVIWHVHEYAMAQVLWVPTIRFIQLSVHRSRQHCSNIYSELQIYKIFVPDLP